MGNESRQLILSPQPSSRRELLKVLRPLQLLFQSERSKNEELLADREYLLKLIELRNEQWARHVSLLESRIEQMKTQEEKIKKFNAAKLELLVDTKTREASSYKEYAEIAETDLEDAHTCIAALNAEIKALKCKQNNVDTQQPTGACDSTEVKDLKLELKKLKHGYKALKSEKDAKISEKEIQIEALVAEKDFVWNQLKVMESDYVAALKSKNTDLEKSNEAVNMLKRNLEEMEAFISEKDNIICKIKEEMTASVSEKDGAISQLKEKFQASISQKDDLISRLNGEVEKLKKMLKEKDHMISGLHADVAKYASRAGPLCKPADSGSSRTLRSGSKRTRESASWAQPSASKSVSGQQHSTKSRGSAFASTAETRMLFSASFKVPKLKNATSTSGTTTNSNAR
ncbi:GRIP and coiled-coil domain-containing protein 2 [Rhynchospora pubera]|uniref:GRIP and coiled-coil domain-containing protein 2 n=1 Tax=Rhynchospora pubera TaxID=906938 RepID=A0AAV8GQA7_9POAL|nr:GRIP and coiled-coil domain-containing protein 2 [Rhynchospora pubera]